MIKNHSWSKPRSKNEEITAASRKRNAAIWFARRSEPRTAGVVIDTGAYGKCVQVKNADVEKFNEDAFAQMFNQLGLTGTDSAEELEGEKPTSGPAI
ncbi:MAG: hypothetical protein K0S08_445 [Gammaproteobacteria bacterium]|nr:hypothetical protein [Gammaproteobacteria bacterium]